MMFPSDFVVQADGNGNFQAELFRLVVTEPEGKIVRESPVYAWGGYGIVCPSETTSNGNALLVARMLAALLASVDSPYRYHLDRAPYRTLFDPLLEDDRYPTRLYAQLVRDWFAFERACNERRRSVPRRY